MATEDKSIGCLLGVLFGDVLGAPVEGWPPKMIQSRFATTNGKVTQFISGTHMGVRELGERYGMYTDDTNSTIAVATSIVEKQAIDAENIGTSLCTFFKTPPQRGYPKSAQQVMKAIEQGVPLHKAATSIFKDGSYANGGAMRIAPVAVVCREKSQSELRKAVTCACSPTHVHPEGIDGAVVLATAICYLMNLKDTNSTSEANTNQPTTPEKLQQIRYKKDFNPKEFLSYLESQANTAAMKSNLRILNKYYGKPMWHAIVVCLGRNKDENECSLETYGTIGFQIESVVAVACALWSFLSHYNSNSPSDAIIEAIALGGDTDTVASMAGALVGAYQPNTNWIPKNWYDEVEQSKFGRDYLIAMAKQLFKLPSSTLPIIFQSQSKEEEQEEVKE